ncbi:rna-binding protein jag [Ligilactobacillus ceti DSM 22408]|uniref:RNA-binding protein KhpB n=2 Tax=Ligilactobacillus TaxID=2767887 RepID=A0A0R2KIU6_9LACO|nr:rna-binding protein jag [Ligilactobacillus ceti DSM 22408]
MEVKAVAEELTQAQEAEIIEEIEAITNAEMEKIVPQEAEAAKKVETAEEKERRIQAREAEIEAAIRDLGYYLADITKLMGIETSINVMPERYMVYYDFDTKTEGLLIGKHGRTINSLQILAQDYLDKRLHRRMRVMLNVANYRERREETLTRLAKKVARDAVAKGEPQALEAMPSFERKAIHSALVNNKYVKTYSKGRDPHRHIVIEPVKKR